MDYYKKYLKYKNRYLKLKNQFGGSRQQFLKKLKELRIEICDEHILDILEKDKVILNISDIYNKSKVNNTLYNIINKFEQVYEYQIWILEIYLKGNFGNPNSLNNANLTKYKRIIGIFKEYKRLINQERAIDQDKIINLDITKINSLNDLIKEVIKIYKKNRIIHANNETIIIFEPLTTVGSIMFCKDTNWCTGVEDRESNRFKDYRDEGKFYIIESLTLKNKKYGLHLEANQLQDSTNRLVSSELLLQKFNYDNDLIRFLNKIITEYILINIKDNILNLVKSNSVVSDLMGNPLIYDATYYIELIRKLKNVDLNKKYSDDGYTLLMYASQNGNKKIVETLILNKANIEAKNHDGVNSLMLSSMYGHESIVNMLITSKANINVINHIGEDSLLLSSKYGHESIVNRLIISKADVNHTYNYGQTSLIIASENGNLEVVKELLDRCANIENEYENAIENYEKAMENYEDCDDRYQCNFYENIFEDNIWKTSLILATNNGHLEVVKELMKRRKPIESFNMEFLDSLTLAMKNYNLEIVKELLKHNKCLDELDSRGKLTYLINAVEYSNLDMVEELLKAGASTNVSNINGTTSLMIASEKGNKEIAELLISNKADVNTKNNKNETSLVLASQNGHKPIVELLIANGAKME